MTSQRSHSWLMADFRRCVKKKMEGRMADKFVQSASCSILNLFHKWLLSIQYPKSPSAIGTQHLPWGGWLLPISYDRQWKPQNITQQNANGVTLTISEKNALWGIHYLQFLVCSTHTRSWLCGLGGRHWVKSKQELYSWSAQIRPPTCH